MKRENYRIVEYESGIGEKRFVVERKGFCGFWFHQKHMPLGFKRSSSSHSYDSNGCVEYHSLEHAEESIKYYIQDRKVNASIIKAAQRKFKKIH